MKTKKTYHFKEIMETRKIKILNCYCGIGGNRKLWSKENLGFEIEVTAVEIDENIAKIYSDFFPDDTVIVGDAHQYLLENFKKYDFIWSSPPCPTHSDIRRCGVHRGIFEPVYPDMKLYQEIILLKHFSKKPFVAENVRSYYEPLIKPTKLERHYFWGNFHIKQAGGFTKRETAHDKMNNESTLYGYNLLSYGIKDKKKILRNLVNPQIGLHILNCAFNSNTLFKE